MINGMHPIVKAFVIGLSIWVPVTLAVNLFDPSDGVVALVTFATMAICVLILGRYYDRWIEQGHEPFRY